MVRTRTIVISVIVGLVVAAGVAVLIWWLVRDTSVNIFGDVRNTAALTAIPGAGHVFWWFFPTTAETEKPLLLWLDGVTGVPPSLLANFGMLGPFDINMNRREDSWIDEYNLLFVDAPIGTGFSTPHDSNSIPKTVNENVDHLVRTLAAFYDGHGHHTDTPLYIVGQGSGAQLAIALAVRIASTSSRTVHNLQGVILGNGIVSPALALTKLGFYLEELGYIDANGRSTIENLSAETNSLVQDLRYGDAFDRFLTLGDVVNDAGAVAVNLGYIIEKLTNDTLTGPSPDYFGQLFYLNRLGSDSYTFMENTIASALRIEGSYDRSRPSAVAAFRDVYMVPSVEQIEYLLNNTDLTVTIYNGNLDAVSNTPGQLEWVNNLQWEGQEEFRNSPRQTLVVNRLVEGYFRVTDRLKFYWMNAAGQSVPYDSPAAIRRVFQLVTGQ